MGFYDFNLLSNGLRPNPPPCPLIWAYGLMGFWADGLMGLWVHVVPQWGGLAATWAPFWGSWGAKGLQNESSGGHWGSEWGGLGATWASGAKKWSLRGQNQWLEGRLPLHFEYKSLIQNENSKNHAKSIQKQRINVGMHFYYKSLSQTTNCVSDLWFVERSRCPL